MKIFSEISDERNINMALRKELKHWLNLEAQRQNVLIKVVFAQAIRELVDIAEATPEDQPIPDKVVPMLIPNARLDKGRAVINHAIPDELHERFKALKARLESERTHNYSLGALAQLAIRRVQERGSPAPGVGRGEQG